MDILVNRTLNRRVNHTDDYHTKLWHQDNPFYIYNPFTTLIDGGVTAAATAAMTGWAVNSELKNNNITNYLHQRLIAMGNIVRALQNIALILEAHPEIAGNFNGMHLIQNLFNSENHTYSPNMHKLIELLLTDTFTGTPSYFSRKGRVLAAHMLMTQCREEFRKPLEAIGKLNANLNVANNSSESV